MKIGFLLILAFLTQISFAQDYKILTFNTMCDLCGSEKYDNFSIRKKAIKFIIKKHTPDLISLQEIRTSKQAKQIFENLDHYKIINYENLLISYADPTIAINTKHFQVLDYSFHWLGPNKGKFSIGWKYSLPRLAIRTKLRDKRTNKELIFIGAHFDNRTINMEGSAKLINNMVSNANNTPTIFAADTNSTPDYTGYSILLGKNLVDSYGLYANKEKVEGKPHQDLCYYRKGDSFPLCRVDHVLLSKNHNWKIKSWDIDLFKFGKKKNFPSDHRPVITNISLGPTSSEQ